VATAEEIIMAKEICQTCDNEIELLPKEEWTKGKSKWIPLLYKMVGLSVLERQKNLPSTRLYLKRVERRR